MSQNIVLNKIQSKLTGATTWRRRMQTSYPDDNRNRIAVEILDRISIADQATVNPDLLFALEPFKNSQKLTDCVNEVARETGFRFHPHNMDEFILAVIEKLSPSIH